jgi:hypothetical protein
MAKLKVFAWSNGLKTYAVATTSRPKALQAWGIHQDLFADGTAREVDDPALVAAATAAPGDVIERAVGGGAARAMAAAKPPQRSKGATAARKRAAELKAKRAALDDEHAQRLQDIERRRRELDDEVAALEEAHQAARAALADKLKILTGGDA